MKTHAIIAVAAISILAGCVGYVPTNDPGYGYRNEQRNDGYRNRDRDRDRDGIPNRMDRDRDGDGVPNRMDNRPNNPNRY